MTKRGNTEPESEESESEQSEESQKVKEMPDSVIDVLTSIDNEKHVAKKRNQKVMDVLDEVSPSKPWEGYASR